ncbi:hypothetical protein ACVDG8_013340 [Mesorhizobium sp. ORM8.1]
MSNNHSHRTGASYSFALFIGAFLAIALLGEPLTAPLGNWVYLLPEGLRDQCRDHGRLLFKGGD